MVAVFPEVNSPENEGSPQSFLFRIVASSVVIPDKFRTLLPNALRSFGIDCGK